MIKIEIVSNVEKKMEEKWKYADKLLKGEISMKKGKTLILTPEMFAKIFSPEKVKLMLRIEKNKLNSIYQLAKELNRKYESVYRDIKLLKSLGIIKLKEKDNKKIPFIGETVKLPEFSA